MLHKKLLSVLLLVWSVAGTTAEPVMPFLQIKPAIDGKVSAAEWQGAEKRLLKKLDDRGGNSDKTVVYFGRDEQNFYAAFICYDSDTSKIKCQWRTPEERDNSIWSDDCVELRFDPWNSPKETFMHRHIVVNSNAVIYDAIGRNPVQDFDLTANAYVGKEFWSVEIAVPLNDLLGYKSHGVELWRVGLARINPRTKKVFSLTGANVINLASADHYLTYRSGKIDPAKPFTITGFVNSKLFWRSENTAETLTAILEQFALDYRKTAENTVSVLDARTPSAAVEAKIHKDTRILRFSVPENYSFEWNPPQNRTRNTPVKITEKPLYKELWNSEPVGAAKDGSMIWSHGFTSRFLPIALEFGIPWEESEALQTAARYRLLLHGIAASMFNPMAYNWHTLMLILNNEKICQDFGFL